LGLWSGDFALWLAARLNKSAVVTEHVVDIFSWVFERSLKLSASKDDDLSYDFKRGSHFSKTILTSKRLKKV
jgi:hypothetical protein